MLSKDAIADVVEVLRPGDFYRPAHQSVYDCILDLYSRGEPADPITVAAEMERRGELRRIGGAPYLHTLIATVPTAANAGYYAEIVAEKAVLRRLVEAGTRIVQLGYAGQDGSDVNEIVDRAQSAIYEVTERRTTEDYVALEELLQPTMDEIDAIASRGGSSLGVPTGFADFDDLTNGLHPGQMIIVAARPGVGKALALDTPLPTPTGWTTMGEVKVSDQLIDAAGKPTTVVAATDVMHNRPCYEVEFSDGTVITADAEHQWLTQNTRATGRIRTTSELADDHAGHFVVNAQALDSAEYVSKGPAYVVGVWLGNNCSAEFGLLAPEVICHIEAEGFDVPPKGPALWQTAGLDEAAAFVRAARSQRSALLAGLMDVAGTVAPDGRLRLSVASGPIADLVHELIVGLGYTCQHDAGELVFETEDRVFRMETKHLLHKELVCPVRHARYIVDVRQVPSVPVRCVEVDNADHLYLASRSMIPTHNSTLGLDWARSCSIKHGMSSVIFSLEMSKTEIVMRMLSAEAKIRLADMRGGRMTDDDWTRLARRMSEISEAPLFVDDSPNMTMMEIRAKARRLKQRNDLKLIVLDYMQLMTSGKRVESRQQEVSEFSRSLKLLAKELEVPVVAMSQLNRGPEQRTDKRPMLADLRESGCLTSGTRILRADTGGETTLGDLLASGEKPLVWSLDERMRTVAMPMTKVFPSGVKEVFRLRMTSGRELEATANHPFMTIDGWVPLGELKPGDRLASPRQVPEPVEAKALPEAEVVLLAHLIGDGSFVRRQPIRYTSIDEGNLVAVTNAATHFGITAVRDEHAAAGCTSLRLPAPYRLTHGKRNPIAAWLDEFGLFGLRSHEKFVPQQIFSAPNSQVALFLHHLWATDGSIRWDDRAGQARIYYASTSRRLVDDVSQLLLRVGVLSRIKRVRKTGRRDCWHLYVYGAENQLRFVDEVGANGLRGLAAKNVAEQLKDVIGNTNLDTVPSAVWTQVRSLLSAKHMTHREFSAAMGSRFCGSTMWKHSPSRSRLARVAAVLDDAKLEMLATNDVFWDEIAEIESLGEQSVYDGTVPGTHSFVANGIHVHNSLEQDADMVVLIHRPDAWERDDPRAGEADLIIAKHRAGPTATITVAHQLHYSKFADLAQA
ncbi:replicative DNA helicase [Kibdelosporangium philippinense]|uniref:Replicative DNA helicase n=2 Tax=Kibdelosporangium philippinense TaxID=211113 RepID=A0ABS8ZE30_9PSEU|nr:replicative DNA helicase [Kibdelosporangium philippinense]